jgi:DNA-binding SARP family transcriptional activator/Tfp pilus assembly protein PilF
MLRLLGVPSLSDRPGPKSRTAYVGAAILDLHPARKMTRAQLAVRLWPLALGPVAGNNLRQMLSDVRAWERTSGIRLFEADSVTIARPEGVEPSDVSAFLAIADASTPAALTRLNELYRGDLLEGIEDLKGDTGIWLIAERERLRARFIALALKGALVVRDQAAQDILDRLAELAPYDKEILRAQMVVAAGNGQRVKAESSYRSFAARLERDLGTAPPAKARLLLPELSAAQIAADESEAAVPPRSVPRVLVLPPANAPAGSVAGSDMVLGSALIDEVTHVLSQARAFAVFAPHTARQLAVAPFPQANPYGADYLVRTALLPASGGGNLLRVALTSLATHELLLSDEMRFAEEALGAHHLAMAAALGSKLVDGIGRRELSVARATGSATAFVHYLHGIDLLQGVTLQQIRAARKRFRQALRISPNFARARAMVARSLSMEYLLLGRREMAPLEEALREARRAFEDDPTDPLVHREIGHALIYFDALDEAVENLRVAADHGPHFADVLCTLADGLIHIGRNPDARPILDRALALNPLAPDLYHWIDATSHYFLGDYEGARQSIARMKTPDSAGRIAAAAEAMLGNTALARRHKDRFLAENPDFRLDHYVYPIRDRADREHLLSGMRAAGFV